MDNSIWQPICFDNRWLNVKTEKFDNIYPSWERRRVELQKSPKQYERFIDQLKRKQAIDTGIIERMYDLKKGVTETFIKEGFVDSYLQHGDTNIAPNLLMEYLKDNFEAIDFVFDFVKNDRLLSVGYIKELHSLITRHQDFTEAINSFGQMGKIRLIKGEYKVNPNNPVRENIKYCYCPPEQVSSEMDMLVNIYNNKLTGCHVLVKAAFLHHAFVQIHPFQDGNGRIARLLASLVLIKEGLFPLIIDRDDRIKYIEALEKADAFEFQYIIDVFSFNQIISIERALNWKTVESAAEYNYVLDLLGQKITNYKKNEEDKRRISIKENMYNIFKLICEQTEKYKKDINDKLNIIEIEHTYCEPDNSIAYYYAKQIIDYANEYDYYVNLSLDKCWDRLFFEIDEQNKYRLVFSLHHYGYDNSTFAIGAFLSKAIIKADNNSQEYIDVSLGIPPLTMSSDKNINDLASAVSQQIEISIMATLAYITNEISF